MQQAMYWKCAGLLCATVGAIALYLHHLEPFGPRTYSRVFTAPTSQTVSHALVRLGLTPETLTAAGADAEDVSVIVEAVWRRLDEDRGFLVAIDDDLAAYNPRRKRLHREGKITAEEPAYFGPHQLPGSIPELNQREREARNELEERLDQLFAEALRSRAEPLQDRLSVIRSNLRWDVPMELRTLKLSEAQWIRLRAALANERIARDDPEQQPDPDDQALLHRYRAMDAVIQAKNRLRENLDDVTQSWQESVRQRPSRSRSVSEVE